jgi:hypothetical protein
MARPRITVPEDQWAQTRSTCLREAASAKAGEIRAQHPEKGSIRNNLKLSSKIRSFPGMSFQFYYCSFTGHVAGQITQI